MNQNEKPTIPPKTEYVCGFAFYKEPEGNSVILIEKQRPDWQMGKHNGVGGKIEKEDNNEYYSMSREFQEETNIFVDPANWKKFALVEGKDWKVYFFKTDLTFVQQKSLKKTTDEIPKWFLEEEIFDKDNKNLFLRNVRWLVAMALSEETLFAHVMDSYP